MSDNEALKPHRDAIDRIDASLLQLLNERALHAHTIGEIKGSKAIYRPEREAAVLHRIQKLNKGPLSDQSVTRLFREVMSECLALERPLNIAHLGPKGTFTEQAAIKHFGHAAHMYPCDSIDESVHLVEGLQADYAVIPVENSTEGSVGRSLDLLTTTSLKACGEVVLSVHHHLLRTIPNTDGIQKIYAHAQALAQCHHWLSKNLHGIERISVSSNAEAARLAGTDSSAAAIASQASAALYGLHSIHQNIEDEANNTTRFLVLSHQDTVPTQKDKTSLIISVPNQAGTVYQLLKPFSDLGVSMTKLESRPSRSGLWQYLFFIDIEGHQQDQHVKEALSILTERVAFLKIIGSYPAAFIL